MKRVIGIVKPLHFLIDENAINNNVRNLDTWPYLPDLIPRDDTNEERQFLKLIHESDRSKLEHLQERIADSTRNIKERQLQVVSWFLAAALGVLGNFIVNLFFGAINFNIGALFALITVIAVASFVVGVFLHYYPPNLSFQIEFLPESQAYLLVGDVNRADVNPRAQTFLDDRVAYERGILQYVSLVILAILRDSLRSSDFRVLKVSELNMVSLGKRHDTHYTLPMVLPSYRLTFDFKRRHYFWSPGKISQAKDDLLMIAQSLNNACFKIAEHSLDYDEGKWQERGATFLDSLADCHVDELRAMLEKQIKELANPIVV